MGSLLGAARLAVAQAPPPAPAPAPDDTPTIKVGATIFTDFTYTDAPSVTDTDGNAVHASAFDVSRAYVNISGTLTHLVSFRITPDIKRLVTTTKNLAPGESVTSSVDGSQSFRLKYAYGQLNLDDVLPKGSWVRIGAHQTPYLDFMEGIYRYRFQGSLAAEREGLLSSSDFGISARASFPGDYGELHLGLYNGETYAKGESNDQKSFQIRGTLRPFPNQPLLKGLRLSAFYDADHYVQDGPRNRFIASATFEHERLRAGVDLIDANDRTSASAAQVHGSGYSVWIQPRTRIGIEGLLRRDSFQPDERVDGRRGRTIAGVAYWFGTHGAPTAAALLADYEQVSYDAVLAKPQEKRLALHCLFSF